VTKNDFYQMSQIRRSAAMPSPVKPRLLAVLAVLPLLAACDQAISALPPPERPVQVVRVAFQPENANRDFVGVVRARRETDLAFRVAGKIVTRIVNVGDAVHAGDVVARIDPGDLELQVQSAQAELAAATSNLADAAADEARYGNLKTRGAVAVADYDHKKAARDEAVGRLERAQRALELARNQLGYAELKADVDGVITATLAESGQVVAIGQAVARLAHHGEMEAAVALPETWLEQARTAQASVRLWSDPKRRFAARLRELSPQADPATRTYAARFTIENPDQTVALGMTATLTLSQPAEAPIAKLPLAAILNRGKGPTVYVVDPSGALELRPVTLASFTEDTAFVTAGVSDGERVVTLGVQKLDAGQRVRAIDRR
jgi:RND family efflux transporter MFP subunit